LRTNSPILVGLCVALCLCSCAWPQSPAVTFTFTKIVDSFEAEPGQPGYTFEISGGVAGAPGNSGTKISFVAEPIETADFQLWTSDTSGGTLVKLVDINTPIPGGTGTFTDGYAHRIAGSRIVFLGIDDATSTEGYYSVPAAGGKIIKLVNQSTEKPDGSGTFGPTGLTAAPFNLNAGTEVFSVLGATFSIPVSGTPLAEPANPYQYVICESGYSGYGLTSFSSPDGSGSTMVLVGSNVLGETGIITAPLSGFTGVANACAGTELEVTNATAIATVNTAVPADPHHRNFDIYSFAGPLISGSNIVFQGAAPPLTTNGPYDLAGLYGQTSTTGLRKLVDSRTAVPGGTGTFQNNGNTISGGWAISGSNVVFRGTDAASKEGIYLVKAAGGTITKIVAVGDVLPDGRTVIGNSGSFFQQPIQASSISGASLAVRLDFTDPVQGVGVGIYRVSW